MKQKIKVSVIIPVHNTEKFLSECLDSLITQTLKDIEIICVDDGSTDDSLLVLKKYAKKDARIKVLSQPNINAGAARNYGMEFARGEYLSFLDSDDFFVPNMLESAYIKALNTQADVIVFKAQSYDDKTKKYKPMPWSLGQNYLPKKDPFNASDMPKYIFNAFQNWTWNKIFRRSFIEEKNIHFQEIPRTNDMLFVCISLVQARRISTVDEILINYRVNTGNNLQATNNKTPLAFWNAFIETKKHLQLIGCYEKYQQSYLNWILSGSIYNICSIKESKPRKYAESLIMYGGEIEFHFLDFPKQYYYNKDDYDLYKGIINIPIEQEKLIKNQQKCIEQLSCDIAALRNSHAFRIGSKITQLPHQLKKLIK